MARFFAFFLICFFLAGIASASTVEVVISGTVDYNQIRASDSVLGLVQPDEPVELRFQLDSESFIDSSAYPRRGYFIQQDTFQFSAGSYSVGLENPYPTESTPLFAMRNNDPGVDGFFLSGDPAYPVGVPTDQTGIQGQFRSAFEIAYGESALSSLNVLDAVGTYDLNGLQVYDFAILDGPFYAMGLIFKGMTISLPSAAMPGDFNGDGTVNLADYVVWRNHLGADQDSLPEGSTTDGSGFVDQGEYQLWKDNFGRGSIGAVELTSSVAEPCSSLLITLLAVVLLTAAARGTRQEMGELTS